MEIPNSTPLLLTVAEVRRILRIQRTKVYILIESGSLKAVKVGADWRILRDSVEALIGCKIPSNLLDSKTVTRSEEPSVA